MIAAPAAIGSDTPSAQEDAVLRFLNSDPVLRWAGNALAPGLRGENNAWRTSGHQ
jgi:hypothetical protein